MGQSRNRGILRGLTVISVVMGCLPSPATGASLLVTRRVSEGRPSMGVRTIFVAWLLSCCLSGCAWRTATAEHYFGPVLFRFSPREGAAPAASQVVVIGALAEAGRQWGLSLGFVERITVSPTYMKGGDPDEVQDQVQWSLLTGGPASPPARRWTFSPLYMRVERTGTPALVARRLYGAQLVAGPEARAASLGVVSIARIEPPEDAMSLIYYDGRFPLAARFRVWRISRDGELPPLHLLEESKP